MMRRCCPIRFVGPVAMLACLPLTRAAGESNSTHWPQFRGPQASGVLEGAATPVEWNVETGENLAWKTRIPGLGLSCPIVWGDKVFVTTAVGEKDDPDLKVGLYGDIQPVPDEGMQRWCVICLDRATGKILWNRTACEDVPAIKRHTKASHANSTPATDGTNVVAFFGSEGLYCYDFNGELRWKKSFGTLDSGYYMMPAAQWGFGNSPILHDGMVLVQVDVQKDSFLGAYDVKDGREIWKTERKDVPTWCTPTVHVSPQRSQVICNGYMHAGGYDLKTGDELWKLTGGGDIPVPTPVIANDLVFLTSAHGPSSPVYAIKLTSEGDITPNDDKPTKNVPWFIRRGGNYMQTPLIYGDLLYTCRDNGVLTCYDARSGEKKYAERIAGERGLGGFGFTASMVANNGRLYVTSEDGKVNVIEAGPEYKKLATNEVGESCMATPAISDGMLLVRGQKHLFALAGRP